ncbi:MAG: succinylglutamate desuccinylase/aspartoacylase family protein [Pseudomonadales bacterium]|nr:succinylglutamate desuccinylase/aspartoacylase family protein [Pseudomonadales bacterium]
MDRRIKAFCQCVVFFWASSGFAEQEHALEPVSEISGTQIQAIQHTENPPVAPNVDLKKITPPPVPEIAPVIATQPEPRRKPSSSRSHELVGGSEGNEDAFDEIKIEKFIILGSEVPPATATRLAWTPNVSIAGLTIPTPVLVINGKNPGKTLCMTAAIHGDELNGVEIVRRVMYDIVPEKLTGKIIGIPIVNLKGFQRASRYLPDRRDLNRAFPGDPQGSLAARIAYSLFYEVIVRCDYLIDLHTGSLRRTNLLQVRADMSQPEVVKFTHGFDDTVVVHS